VSADWIEKYKGKFDDGWDQLRQKTLDNQKALGILPSSATLPPRSPGITAWDDLPANEKIVNARQAEVSKKATYISDSSFICSSSSSSSICNSSSSKSSNSDESFLPSIILPKPCAQLLSLFTILHVYVYYFG